MIRTPTTRDYLAISLFWLGFSFFWGALLTSVLQERVQTFVKVEYSMSHPTYVAPPTDATNALETRAQKEIEALQANRSGWLLASGALVSMLTQLVFGALSDNARSRWGRRKPFLVFGTLLASLGVFAFPHAQNYAQLFAVFLWIQLFINVAAGPYSALLPDLIPAEFHGRAAAFMGFFSLVGRTGGMVAGALALRGNSEIGLNALTIAFLVLLNGLMLATALMTHETPTHNTSSTRSFVDTFIGIFRVDLRGQSSFVWVLVSRFVINTGVYTILPFLLFYLISCYKLTKSDALAQIAVIGILVNVMGLIATFPAGLASDRTSKKNVLYVTCILCVIGGMGFVFSQSIGFALLSAAIFGLGYGAFQAVDWALICNVLPPGAPAKYMGLWSCADTVPQIVAPFIGGAVASYFIQNFNASVGYRAVMFTAIVWFVLGTFVIRFVKERTAREIGGATKLDVMAEAV